MDMVHIVKPKLEAVLSPREDTEYWGINNLWLDLAGEGFLGDAVGR